MHPAHFKVLIIYPPCVIAKKNKYGWLCQPFICIVNENLDLCFVDKSFDLSSHSLYYNLLYVNNIF